MINQEIDYQQVKIHQIWKKRQTKHEMPWEAHAKYVIDMLKQEYNVRIAKDVFISNVKTPQKNKFLKNTQQNNNTYARKINFKHLKILCSFSIRRR